MSGNQVSRVSGLGPRGLGLGVRGLGSLGSKGVRESGINVWFRVSSTGY